jgi:hypothetical protein
VVVLDEVGGQAEVRELVGAEGFGEEAAGILKNLGNDDRYIAQVSRFDLNLQVSLLRFL